MTDKFFSHYISFFVLVFPLSFYLVELNGSGWEATGQLVETFDQANSQFYPRENASLITLLTYPD